MCIEDYTIEMKFRRQFSKLSKANFSLNIIFKLWTNLKVFFLLNLHYIRLGCCLKKLNSFQYSIISLS